VPALGGLSQRRFGSLKDVIPLTRTSSRLGILSMILCFALGIANIFTIFVLVLIISIICL
jgi:hypothetical protein